ncbi:MAG: hypothetical protein Q9166_006654 [cf. Caloplaca sp. 2 TL-2023]
MIRIIAAAEHIPLNHFEVDPRKNINTSTHLSHFPLSRGKIPGLVGPGIEITEVIAIATYLAKLYNKSRLFGDGSPEQEATILSWMSWANQELLSTLAIWFLPLIPNLSRPAPYHYATIEAGKVTSLAVLDTLEDILKEKKYLVGKWITLADIFVAIVVSRGLEWVLDAKWREAHPGVVSHVEMIRDWEPSRGVVKEWLFIEEETPNINPYE